MNIDYLLRFDYMKHRTFEYNLHPRTFVHMVK